MTCTPARCGEQRDSDAAGGTIISKNRDWAPDHSQVLKMHRSAKGYAYFGLYAENGTEPGIKAGVNQKGLTVITATAGSIPKDRRASQPGKHGVIGTLLSGYASCDEVLAKKDTLFPSARTMFLMLSDRSKIVLVEVGLEGKYALKTSKWFRGAHQSFSGTGARRVQCQDRAKQRDAPETDRRPDEDFAQTLPIGIAGGDEQGSTRRAGQ